MMRRISARMTSLAVAVAGSQFWFAQAQASQGPGVNPGTVGATTQLAMAIVVYGGSAVLVAIGLIGAARQRKTRV